jgi:hypothetical protein
LSNYKITFGVNAWEDGKIFLDPKSKKPVRQDTSMSFKTGPCPTTIPQNYISHTFPFNKQRHFLSEESKNGAIVLSKSIPCLFDPAFEYKMIVNLGTKPSKTQGKFYQGDTPSKSKETAKESNLYTKTEYYAKEKMVTGVTDKNKFDKVKLDTQIMAFKALETPNEISVPVIINGSTISFTMPELPKNAAVELRFVKMVSSSFLTNARKNNKATAENKYVNNASYATQAGMSMSNDNSTNQQLAAYNAKNAIVLTRDKITKNIEPKSNPITMYSFSCRTSEYGTFKEKMNTISQMTQSRLRDDLAIDIVYNSPEGFEALEIEPQSIKTGAVSGYLPALISAKEINNSWETNRIEKDVYRKAGGFTMAMLNAGYINKGQWLAAIMTIAPADNLEIVANNSYLQIFNTRPWEIIDSRMGWNKDLNQQLMTQGHILHKKISDYHGSKENSCFLGVVCNTWETIKGWYIKDPIWKLAHDTWDYRNNQTGNFQRRLVEFNAIDLNVDYRAALPITPTLVFTYKDPLRHTVYETKRYIINR